MHSIGCWIILSLNLSPLIIEIVTLSMGFGAFDIFCIDSKSGKLVVAIAAIHWWMKRQIVKMNSFREALIFQICQCEYVEKKSVPVKFFSQNLPIFGVIYEGFGRVLQAWNVSYSHVAISVLLGCLALWALEPVLYFYSSWERVDVNFISGIMLIKYHCLQNWATPHILTWCDVFVNQDLRKRQFPFVFALLFHTNICRVIRTAKLVLLQIWINITYRYLTDLLCIWFHPKLDKCIC